MGIVSYAHITNTVCVAPALHWNVCPIPLPQYSSENNLTEYWLLSAGCMNSDKSGMGC